MRRLITTGTRAAHLYGLIVSGAVLATASDEFRLSRVAVILVCTLGIYWAAETYVHWIAARSHVQRDLTREERRRIVADGWPLVAACAVPLTFLGAEALLGMETAVALDVTLAVNTVLLFVVGWQMGSGRRPRGGAVGAVRRGHWLSRPGVDRPQDADALTAATDCRSVGSTALVGEEGERVAGCARTGREPRSEPARGSATQLVQVALPQLNDGKAILHRHWRR